MRSRLARLVAVAVTTIIVAVGLAVPAQAANGPAGEVFAMVNQQRAANGLPALVSDPVLDNAAWQWANYLASNGLFEHSSSEWRSAMISGAGWVNSGENIAAGYTSAASVMSGWMGSTGHRNNILGSSYVGMGVAYVQGGPWGHYWVQIFAGSLPRVAAGNAPTISGTAAVGQKLTATTNGWPGGTSIGWSWLSNGVPIPGATSSSYVPTISDAGRKISVTATGSLPGYYATSRTSGSTATVSGGPAAERVSGSDRYAAAVEMSRRGFTAGVNVVFVASGLNFPDALSAGPAAAQLGGPLLLTAPDALPTNVRNEIVRLQPAQIVVVGGPLSVTPAVLAALKTIAPTIRLGGADRYAAGRSIVDHAFDSATVAYIATGASFPDALTAGAAASTLGAPVILVNGAASTVDGETLALLRELGVTSVRIAGGPNSVSPGILSHLSTEGFAVERIGGADRYEAAANINAGAFAHADTIYLASGANFPDALAGSALAASTSSPLFISAPGCMPESIGRGLTWLKPTRIILLGGVNSLSTAVASFQRC